MIVGSQRILLIGAGYTARIVADELVRHRRADELVAVLDDDASTHGTRLGSAPVVGSLDDLADVAGRDAIDKVVIAIPSLSSDRFRAIVLECRRLGLQVQTMPSIVELLGSSITSRQLRPVEVGDLLRRTEVRCDEPPPGYLRGQRVLITGAGGSIGRELARQVCRAEPDRVVLLGHGENSIHAAHAELTAQQAGPPLATVIADITDRRSLARLFATQAPTVIFHAAAHKHVPLMEQHPAEAVRNNVLGTLQVVRCAEESGVHRLVLVSTDKAVAPASIMGATKRVCEWIVGDVAARTGRPYVTVRFGNVLGSRGSVVPVLEQQIARGGPVTLTHPDVTRFFMTIAEAAYLVLHAGGMDDGAGLYVLDMGEPVRIVDLAADLIGLVGLLPDAVPLHFTGLRPGEKLSESMWEAGSVVTASARRDVWRVREATAVLGGDALRTLIARLVSRARHGDVVGIHRTLGDAIPTFTSSLGAPAGRGGGATGVTIAAVPTRA